MSKRDVERVVLRGNAAFPLKKGDLAVLRNTYFSLTSGANGEYYDVVYVGFGGKKPREENRAPIDVSRVVAVVRPGWKLKGLGLGVTGRSVEEVIKKAWENREVAE